MSNWCQTIKFYKNSSIKLRWQGLPLCIQVSNPLNRHHSRGQDILAWVHNMGMKMEPTFPTMQLNVWYPSELPLNSTPPFTNTCFQIKIWSLQEAPEIYWDENIMVILSDLTKKGHWRPKTIYLNQVWNEIKFLFSPFHQPLSVSFWALLAVICIPQQSTWLLYCKVYLWSYP